VYNGERLLTGDACFFYSENKYGVYQGAGIALYDGPLDYERVVQDIDAKLDRLPRLRQQAVPVPFHIAHHSWEYDPDFDIRNHIIPLELEAPVTNEQVLEAAIKISEDFMPRDRPLWRIYVVNGLEGGRSATINLIHHALSDGGGMIAFGEVLNDAEPNPERGTPAPREFPPIPGPGTRFLRGVRDDITNVLRIIAKAPRRLATAPVIICSRRFRLGCKIMARYLTAPTIKMPYNKESSGQRASAWTVVSMTEIQSIRRAFHGTINDIFLSTTARAIELYAQKNGIQTKGKNCLLQAPVDVRPPGFEEELGNHVATMSICVPFGIDDPVERLNNMHERTTEAKEANLGFGMHIFLETWRNSVTPPIARWIRLAFHAPLSQRIIHRLKPRPSLHVCASNVRGPSDPIYLAGRKCIMNIPLGLVVHGCGYFATAFSQDGNLFLGAGTDKGSAPDPETIIEFQIEAYEELRRAAGVVRKGSPPAISPFPPTVQKRAHTNGTSKRHIDVAESMLKTEEPGHSE
jgi:WS/DGAT/MGAT family acyltransferase